MRCSRIVLLLAVPAVALIQCACSEPYPVRTYAMGEKVGIGHIIYTVFEQQWLTHIGDGATARLPQNRFYLVRMSAVNSGGTEMIMPTLSLVDDKGNNYTELPNGDGVPQWIGFLRQVRPAESAQGNLVFDCPPQHYKLRLTDEDQSRTAFIDLPLSFDSETPEVPIPGSDKKQ